MAKVLKFWAGLGLAAVSSTISAEAITIQKMQHPQILQMAATAGEAGESGSAIATPDDQAKFIADLALVEGHMRVAVELYKLGKGEAASVHIKHPADELYAALKPALEVRKAKGFAEELEALSMAIDQKAATASVDQLFEKMRASIVASRGEGEMVSAHSMAAAVEILLRSATADYAVGVIGQDVKVPKEYQDAWGFTQAARAIMADISKMERDEHKGPLAEIDAALTGLDVLWPDMSGEKKVDGNSKLLAVAAAKVELAGLAIK
jgi:C1A family cysteine protease